MSACGSWGLPGAESMAAVIMMPFKCHLVCLECRTGRGSVQLGQDLLDGLDGDGGGIAIDVVPGAGHHADLAVRSERGVGRFRGDPLGLDIGAPDFLFGVDGGVVAEDLER